MNGKIDLSDLKKYLWTATLPGVDKTKSEADAKIKDIIFIDTDVSLKRKNSPSEIKASDFAIACGATVDAKQVAPVMIRSLQDDLKEDKNTVKIVNPHICLRNIALSNAYPFGIYKIDQKSKEDRTITFTKWTWPQNKYPDTFELDSLMQNGTLTRTGRFFPCAFNEDDNSISRCEEFSGRVNGKTRSFVRLIPNARPGVKFSDGTSVEAKPYWFEVTPIVWKIDNAKDLIDNISPRNYASISDNAAVEIIPSTGILTGFSVKENDYSLSQVRHFLNGIGGFNEDGFLNYSIDLTKESVANRFSVVVDDKPMTIDEQLQFYIDNNYSIMLHGASGVGKSRRVKDIDPDCVMIQLRDGILPEEVIGKTAFNDETNKSSWIEPTWYTRIKEVCKKDPNHNHVLFIDEITNVRPYEQSLVYHIVLERSIDGNYGKLPENCVVIAAGNSPKESEVASPMPEPLYRRFNAHIELPLDLKDWLEWGSKVVDGRPRIHPLVASFVAAYSNRVFYTKYDKEKSEFAIDPRGWEQLSHIIYTNKGVIREELIANKIGAENAKSFLSFAKIPLITIEDIMNDCVSPTDIPTSLNAKYALMLSFRVATMEEVGKVREFIGKHLGKEQLATYDSLWADTDEKAIFLDRLNNPNEADY